MSGPNNRSVSSPLIIPARPDPRVAGVFAWYVARMFAKKFAAIRLANGSGAVMRSVADHPGPLVVLLNHGSWWDPLIAFHLSRVFVPGRAGRAPMEAQMLRKFGFFRKLGIFGIDPDAPGADVAFLEAMTEFFASNQKPTLWITPQGQFADVRTPVRIRPGAAALAARWERTAGAKSPVRVLSVALEYGFWVDQKPEIFMRFEEVTRPGGGGTGRNAETRVEAQSESDPTTNTLGSVESAAGGSVGGPALSTASSSASSTARWLRAMTAHMRSNAETLSKLVIAREPSAFENLIGGDHAATGRVHPVYDAFLRLTGRSGKVEAKQR